MPESQHVTLISVAALRWPRNKCIVYSENLYFNPAIVYHLSLTVSPGFTQSVCTEERMLPTIKIPRSLSLFLESSTTLSKVI